MQTVTANAYDRLRRRRLEVQPTEVVELPDEPPEVPPEPGPLTPEEPAK
jgi:DNA-directed RNA polymerase specialized sigma24 family protein